MLRAMVLRSGMMHVAVKLQEASDMMHSNVQDALRDAVTDAHKGTGTWANYIDHNGDGSSGDCMYSADGNTYSAPYEIQDQAGKQVANVDVANRSQVTPRVSYVPVADDDDNYASMMESKLYTTGDMPLCERFISKDERTSASDDSFAGKGKSFPILKAGDVMAAVRSMGRAGTGNYGVAQLKANIIRIAKARGFTSELPKTWRGDTTAATEAARVAAARGSLKLSESIDWSEQEALTLVESAGAVEKEIKIMAPGAGSSAIYPAEVLKRDGPATFKKNTQIYINHATKAEEAARPEGDWHKLAGALSTDAYWKESAKTGDGLYAMAKFDPAMASSIMAKAPWSGMSIRANGTAAQESGRTITKNGLPVLASFTGCESIDIVTRAGAGGMILTESARVAGANSQEVDMTDAQITALVEAAVTKAVAAVSAPVQLLESRARRGDALVEGNRVLAPLTGLSEAWKQEIITRAMGVDGSGIPVKEGQIDIEKFDGLVIAESKRVAALLGTISPSLVRGMGSVTPIDTKTEEQRVAEAKNARELAQYEESQSVQIFESLGMPAEAAKLAAKGRAA